MSKINMSGSYKVKLRVTDRAKFATYCKEQYPEENRDTSWTSKTVERWLNSDDEMTNLFGRWADQGITASLGRFVGR